MSQRQGVVILGSTGSVGRNALDVVTSFPERFTVVGLAANTDIVALQNQIDRYKPSFISIGCAGPNDLSGSKVIDGDDPLLELATLDETDIVVVATTGHAAIPATLAALRAGKIVALANKETIVAAGSIVMAVANDHPGQLRPVDSEHSAIWQCLPLDANRMRDVEQILLTASGGPFRGYSADQLANVTVEDALSHPTWEMGTRITVDSATLMNKGFELIETSWLFDVPMEQIEIVVHPQSIVHSMVEYCDGSIIAQLSSHDMRLPIQYALTYPERPRGPSKRLRLQDIATLEFEQPDYEIFRAPQLARHAFAAGGTYPAVLSTADEYAVHAFVEGRIAFTEIVDLVERALDAHDPAGSGNSLEKIRESDRWTIAFLDKALDKRT